MCIELTIQHIAQTLYPYAGEKANECALFSVSPLLFASILIVIWIRSIFIFSHIDVSPFIRVTVTLRSYHIRRTREIPRVYISWCCGVYFLFGHYFFFIFFFFGNFGRFPARSRLSSTASMTICCSFAFDTRFMCDAHILSHLLAGRYVVV